MRRWRWISMLGFLLVLSGCSGTQIFGVAAQDDGSVEVLSYCTNDGLTNVTIRSDRGVIGTVDAFVGDGEQTVVFSARVLAQLKPDDVITIDADYAQGGLIGESLTIEFGSLEPGTVVVSGFEPQVTTPAEFEADRVSCGFDTTALVLVLAVVVGVLILVMLAIAIPIVLLLLYLRKRRRDQVTTF